MVIQVLHCRHCQSQNVIRHGTDANGTQRYRCQDCQRTFRQQPKCRAHPGEFRARVLAAYQERCSMRGVCRIFGIDRETLTNWLKKSQPLAAAPADASASPPR